ncbi:MAG TPA: permease [Caulobacteraceae bacterium]|nr:permease [Caulobacteraceae bacterium]
MIVPILLAGLVLFALAHLAALVPAAVRRRAGFPGPELIALGAITNFFDTLGIGSFAPTTAWIKLRRLTPDAFLPAVLNVGHCLPTIAEALIFITVVKVDTSLLVACIVAAVAGAATGAPLVVRAPVRLVQGIVGLALLIASALYALANLHMMPAGGSALALPLPLLAIAAAAHFVMGVLMTFGIGLYAPSLIVLSLLGLNPLAAFPIMMGSCAFLMPASSFRFIASERIDLRLALGLAIGGVPAVLVAAFLVKHAPLTVLRWGVVVVVLYAAAMLLRSALRGEAAPAPAPVPVP